MESSGREWRESLANEDVVGADIGVEPVGKVEGSLDEKELTVSVPGSERDGRAVAEM